MVFLYAKCQKFHPLTFNVDLKTQRENWLRSTAAIYDESKTVTVMYDRNESARVKTENRIKILSKQTHLWAICGLWTAVVIAGVQSRSDLEQC